MYRQAVKVHALTCRSLTFTHICKTTLNNTPQEEGTLLTAVTEKICKQYVYRTPPVVVIKVVGAHEHH